MENWLKQVQSATKTHRSNNTKLRFYGSLPAISKH